MGFGIHVLPGLQYMYVNTMAMKFPVRYHQLGFQKKGYFSNSFKHPFLEVKYAPGPCLKCTLLQGHVCHMLLEHYAFQMWSWTSRGQNNTKVACLRIYLCPETCVCPSVHHLHSKAYTVSVETSLRLENSCFTPSLKLVISSCFCVMARWPPWQFPLSTLRF